MPKAARRPAKAPSKKAAAQKTAKKAAPRKSSPAKAALSAPLDAEALIGQLARSSGLSREELLQRALRAFAAAHGTVIAEATPAVAPILAEAAPQAVAAPAAAALPAATPAPEGESVSEKRLYVHGIGRPPIEMIADKFFIGSSPRGDLWVNSTGIETKHLRIDRVNGKYYATDLNTEKGTVLHGQPVKGATEIHHEDSFYLAGYHRVRFYIID